MYTIKRVGIGSAFRVGAVSSALVWAVFGILFVLWMLAIGSAVDSTTNSFSNTNSSDFAEISGGFTIFFYLCMIPIQAVIGGIMGALYAFIYNIVAGWVGGLELELEQRQVYYSPGISPAQEPQKRQPDNYDPFE